MPHAFVLEETGSMPRVNSIQEVFDAMPSRFLPDQAGDMRAVIQFDLSGEGGGQWFATIADRALQVSTGQAPSPSLTLTTTANDYLAIINGELKPMAAFMQGRVRVRGDMPLLLKMQSLFNFS
jgi:putative sterol carrier protein